MMYVDTCALLCVQGAHIVETKYVEHGNGHMTSFSTGKEHLLEYIPAASVPNLKTEPPNSLLFKHFALIQASFI